MPGLFSAPAWVAIVILLAGVGGWAIGWYMLTERDPQRRLPHGNAIREIARWSTASVAILVLTIFLTAITESDLICIFAFLTPLLLLISTFATVMHQNDFAQRIPDKSIAIQTVVYTIILIVGGFFVVFLTILGGVFGLWLAGVICALIVVPLQSFTLLRLRKRLLQMIRQT